MMGRGVEQALFILLLALALPLSCHGGRPHISNLNVLLPPRTSTPVHYRLQGTGGCFLWTWDHHDIINLEPEFNVTTERCSTSAVITVIAPFEERQSTAVHATDTITGEVLRCEVFIDRITRIQIFHHSVKLDLDGWSTLRVRAFDAEDNVFSSLVGLKFLWELSTFGTENGYPYPERLVHVALKDSPLTDCGCICNEIDTQIELEEMGFGSDLYVVRGVSAGQETVTVQLAEPNMLKLTDSIVLTVAEAISLEPHSPLYIIPGTTFRFRLRAMRQNVLTEISLPSAHHQWFSTETTVVSVHPHDGNAAAQSLGVANIVVEDLRVKGHQQIATVHVVTPTRLELTLVPLFKKGTTHVPQESKVAGAPWHVVTGREYVLLVRAYSQDSRPIYLTQSNDLRMMFSNLPYWDVLEVPEDAASDHGWQNATLLRPVVEGSGTLAVELTYGDAKEVTREQLLNVCSPTTVILEHDRSARVILLPWSLTVSQEYHLKAEGGCGEKPSDYVWSSSNPSVVSVNSLGKLYSKGPGKAAVRVSSVKDQLNSDEIQVEVSVPSAIGLVQALPVEVEIQTVLPVAVTLTTLAGPPYSKCDAYNALVQWELSPGEGHFKFVDSPPSTLDDISVLLLKSPQTSHQPICAWNTVLPSRPGRTSVTASLKVSSAETPNILEETWTIAAYAPLALTQVTGGNCCGGYSCKAAASLKSPCHSIRELLLVAGSGIKVILVGGPERWRQGPVFVEFQDVYSDETGEKTLNEVSVQRTGDAGGRGFYINCYGFGNYTLMFRRGYEENEGTVSIVASTSLSIMCGAPSSIVLIIDEEDNKYSDIKSAIQLERDQERKRVTPVTVVNGRSFRVAAVALHASGKPFANASSLVLKWQLDGCTDLASWDDDASQESWERSLGLRSVVGLCSVRATLTRSIHSKIPSSSVRALTAELDKSSMFLTDAAQLQLVASLRLDPKETLLFCHPEAKATLQVLGGTTDFETSVNDSKVATAFPPQARTSSLVVAARAKGTALVTVVDIGLASPATATALVHVADISWIKLTPDDVILELESVVEIHVQVGDSVGRIFHPSQYVLFNIRVHIQDEVISLVNLTTRNQVLGSSFFIRGEALGISSFHVSAEQASKRDIHTEVIKVEVYAPIFIQPTPLVLAPGAQYMLVVQGGPTDGMLAEFLSPNALVASVDSSSGLVIANSVGNEIILVKARGNDGRPLGEATTEVIVSLPVTMFLEVRSGQLGVGREMSIFPYSSEGNLFSFYELCTAYDWFVSDEEVLQLESVSSPSPESNKESAWLVDTGFSARVVGRSPGKATVSVSFLCHFHGHLDPIKYAASDTILVLPDPPLAVGMGATWVLPPSYRSSKLLPQRTSDRLSASNRAITYSLLHDGGGGGGDLLAISDGHIETADRIDVNCIHVRDRLSGRSEIAVCIRVAEVSQMTVGDDDFPFHVSELSVGTQQHFTVTLRDNIGTPYFEFDLHQMPLLIETNRADVVALKARSSKISGGSTTVTVAVEALRQGKALVRISQRRKPNVADYILVFVGAYVHPRNPLMYIGDRISFSIAGKGLHAAGAPAERGHWSSRNEYVVKINSRTGEAEAMSDGSTAVSFNGSRITAYTFVTVARVASVVVEAPILQFLTNVPQPEQPYSFDVKFRDTQGRNVIDRPISYDCDVEPPVIGTATPWHDSSSGSFHCLFTPHAPEKISYDVHHNPENKKTLTGLGNSEGVLQMTVSATIRRTPDVFGAATATFAGGFSLIDAPPSKLDLSSRSNKTKISLVGSVGAIAVSWNRKDSVNVHSLTKTTELGVAGYAVYEISLREEDKSFTDTLAFLLKTTGHRVEIPMSYDAGFFYVAALSHQIVTVALITLVSIFVPLFLCTKMLDFPRPFKRPAASSMVAQVMQDGSPSGVLLNGNVGSPHTPPLHQYRAYRRSPGQPYTDYMSRTIDQTPYFTRQNNRNADPSRSY